MCVCSSACSCRYSIGPAPFLAKTGFSAYNWSVHLWERVVSIQLKICPFWLYLVWFSGWQHVNNYLSWRWHFYYYVAFLSIPDNFLCSEINKAVLCFSFIIVIQWRSSSLNFNLLSFVLALIVFNFYCSITDL